ncbi:MAG: hypothetical protein GY828_00090 [Candidatus Gracilibacteria bacterium]|nr:hypothetical protein [Candidatus Gracilibacteria bacterium]
MNNKNIFLLGACITGGILLHSSLSASKNEIETGKIETLKEVSNILVKTPEALKVFDEIKQEKTISNGFKDTLKEEKTEAESSKIINQNTKSTNKKTENLLDSFYKTRVESSLLNNSIIRLNGITYYQKYEDDILYVYHFPEYGGIENLGESIFSIQKGYITSQEVFTIQGEEYISINFYEDGDIRKFNQGLTNFEDQELSYKGYIIDKSSYIFTSKDSSKHYLANKIDYTRTESIIVQLQETKKLITPNEANYDTELRNGYSYKAIEPTSVLFGSSNIDSESHDNGDTQLYLLYDHENLQYHELYQTNIKNIDFEDGYIIKFHSDQGKFHYNYKISKYTKKEDN